MRPAGRFAIAAALSFALHGIVISGHWIPVPQPPGEPRPLTARLVPAPAAVPPPAPKPRARAARRAPPRAPHVAVVAAPSPLILPEPEPVETPVPAIAEEVVEPEPPQQLALAAESSEAIARSLPRRGRISYGLYYGEDRTYVGKVVQSWEVEDGRYLISSDAETEGIVELFRPQRYRYLSQGQVLRDGLRPDRFLMSRTRRGRQEAARARFDWNEGRLDYGLARDPKHAELAPGAQDFLSFIYHYVLMPPEPGQYRVKITTGTRFEWVDVDVGDEENIETPLGVMRALPLRQQPRPGMESFQVWLAPDYLYLPVRIRHYNREGRYSGEQVVNEIRIAEE